MKTGKKALSILLSVIMVLGAVAVGGMSVSAAGNSTLAICGETVIENGEILKNSGTGWRYEGDTDSGKIILDNLTYTGEFIFANNLDLEITGNANLTSTGLQSLISVNNDGNLTLNGSFTLSLQDFDMDMFTVTGNLTVSGGSLNVVNTGARSAIWVYGTMTVDGGSVYAKANGNGAIFVQRGLTVNGGSVYAKTETGDYAFSYGGDLTLNNGEAFALGDWNAKEVLISALKGSGVSDSPYEISNYGGLKEFSSIVNGTNVAIAQNTAACAKLMNDIDASASAENNDWTPIGNDNKNYTGVFDGDGHKITGLTFDDSSANCAGLFGVVHGVKEGDETVGGIVKNVGLEGGKISGFQDVGSVVGNNAGGIIEYCYNTGNVSGSNNVGGVVGHNQSKSTVSNCYNTGSVTAPGSDTSVGGVVGWNYDKSKVSNCYNTGNVSGNNSVGGVAGQNLDNSTVSNCYNTGSVTAPGSDTSVGGVVGWNMDNSTVSNCYNTGNVSGSNNVGGVVGQNFNHNSVENCYNTGNVSGSNNVGGVVGKNAYISKVSNCYYDSDILSGVSAIGDDNAASNNVRGLTTAQMTGAKALDNMVFEYGDGEVSPWQTKANGADVSGKYRLFYPHLKGFTYDLTAASEDWPAKAEVSIIWSEEDSYTYNGHAQMPAVTSVIIGDSSAPEGATVTYSQYKYSNENNKWEWVGISGSPTDSGKYKMEIRDDDEVIETKYFTILDPYTDYTVSYYAKDGEDWSTDTVNPVDAGDYKAVITFLKTEDNGESYVPDESHKTIEKEFKITPKAVTVAAASAEFTYDGYAHSNDRYEVTGLVGSDAITAVVTGSITYPDESPVTNTLQSYIFISGNEENYTVTMRNGELTMTGGQRQITITAASREWTYDGSAHSDKTVMVTSGELVEGDTLVAHATGSVTDVSDTAEGNNTVDPGYRIMRGNRDVTANYTITAVPGTLTINPAKAVVTITGHNYDVSYDSSMHSVSGYDVAISNPLYTESDFIFSGIAAVECAETGIYDMGLAADQFVNTNPNFDVTFNVTDGRLTVNPVPVEVTVRGNSASADYDGSEQSVSGYKVEISSPIYTESDFIFSGTALAKRTEPGTENMGLDASQFSNNNSNFVDVTFVIAEDGKLTVNPVIEFINEDGTPLQSGAVAYGETPQYTGETPLKGDSDGHSYTFSGWSPEITEATENRTYTAVFTTENIDYTATFVDENGETVDTRTFTVETETLDEPAVPAKEGYTGEWEDYELTIGGIAVKPVYTAIEYTATFIADGETVDTKTFTVETETLDEPAVPAKEGYEGKWSEYTIAAGDMEITAEYTPIEYTATFVADGVTVDTRTFTVETESIDEPDVPAKEGFTGEWEEYELTPGDITVNAVYTENEPEPEPEDVCPLDNEDHGDGFFGKVITFIHKLIWRAFRIFGLNVFFKVNL